MAGLPLRVAQVMVPVCVAVAVLRHRLLEIDLIISRALTVALATALVAVGYVLVVVTVGLVVDGTIGFWPSLLATAVVAIAFQPLRSRVVRIADRLAFGTAAAPYEALEDFSRRLGESPDPIDLLPSVAEAAGRAVRARRASVVLHVDAGLDLTASWPVHTGADLTSEQLEVPVVHLAERLGTISVAMPTGQPLRSREHGLLADLADQAGLAFRNARLTAELAGQVKQLSQRNQELESSRVRLISAGDAERRRLERDIARQVVPHLQPLADRLHELAIAPDAATTPATTDLDPLVASLNSALEALREITRGVFPAQLARSRPSDCRRLPAHAHCGYPSAGGRGLGQRPALRPARRGRGVLLRRRGRPRHGRTGRRVLVRGRRSATGGRHWSRGRGASAQSHPRPRRSHRRDRVDARRGRPGRARRLAAAHSTRRSAAAQTARSRAGPNADLVTYAAAPESLTNSSPTSSS